MSSGLLINALSRLLDELRFSGQDGSRADFELGTASPIQVQPASDPREPATAQVLMSNLRSTAAQQFGAVNLTYRQLDTGALFAAQRVRAKLSWGTGGVTETAVVDWSGTNVFPCRNLTIELLYGGKPFGLVGGLGDGDHDAPMGGARASVIQVQASVVLDAGDRSTGRWPGNVLTFPYVDVNETVIVPPFAKQIAAIHADAAAPAGNVILERNGATIGRLPPPDFAGGCLDSLLPLSAQNPVTGAGSPAVVRNLTGGPIAVMFGIHP